VHDDRRHIALPKLFGSPPYVRPGADCAPKTERPLDLDDLPLEAVRSEEDQCRVEQLTGRSYGSTMGAGLQTANAHSAGGEGSSFLRGRSFRLRPPGRRDGGQG